MKTDKDKVIIDRGKLEKLEEQAKGKNQVLHAEIEELEEQITKFTEGKTVLKWQKYYDWDHNGLRTFGPICYYGDKDEFVAQIQPTIDKANAKIEELKDRITQLKKSFWVTWIIAAIFAALFVGSLLVK